MNRWIVGMAAVLLASGCSAQASDDDTESADQASTTRGPDGRAQLLTGKYLTFIKRVDIPEDKSVILIAKKRVRTSEPSELLCFVVTTERVSVPRWIEPGAYMIDGVENVTRGRQHEAHLKLRDVDAAGVDRNDADFNVDCVWNASYPTATEITDTLKDAIRIEETFRSPGGAG